MKKTLNENQIRRLQETAGLREWSFGEELGDLLTLGAGSGIDHSKINAKNYKSIEKATDTPYRSGVDQQKDLLDSITSKPINNLKDAFKVLDILINSNEASSLRFSNRFEKVMKVAFKKILEFDPNPSQRPDQSSVLQKFVRYATHYLFETEGGDGVKEGVLYVRKFINDYKSGKIVDKGIDAPKFVKSTRTGFVPEK